MTTVARSITPPLDTQMINTEYTDFSKKSRHGHGQDVIDANNVRQVAGCIPLDLVNRRVLLISSRKNKDAWVLPKGGWEQDETQKHAAQRETWEEAGIKGTITKNLGVFEERTNKKRHLKAHHWIFEMQIDEVAKKFPEKKKRERRWFTFEESLIATQGHRYIQEALLQSSLNPANALPSPRQSIEEDAIVVKKQTSNGINTTPVINKNLTRPVVNPNLTKPIVNSNMTQPIVNTTETPLQKRKSLVHSIKSIFN
jgi:8-oxo-dGTP pyrophosphatase MutT (NUDIX family)